MPPLPPPQDSHPLNLRTNHRSPNPDYRNRLVIDISKFSKNINGAYVIRFLNKNIPRFNETSPILKIGKAGLSFYERFRQYNNKNEASVYTGNTFSFYKDYTEALTDYETMWRLPRLVEISPIIIDFYYSKNFNKSPADLEKYLLCLYVETHLDTPPLNKVLS